MKAHTSYDLCIRTWLVIYFMKGHGMVNHCIYNEKKFQKLVFSSFYKNCIKILGNTEFGINGIHQSGSKL